MKKLVLIIVIILNFFSALAQNSTNNFFNEKDSIQITGKIIGYHPSQEEHFITFSTTDIFGKASNQSIQIEDNGDFWIKLYQPFDGDIQLNYKNVFLKLFTKHNMPLIIEIDNDKIDAKEDLENSFLFKGQLATENNLILKFNTAYDKQNFPSTDFDKNLSDSMFAEKCKNNLNQKLQFLQLFIEKNKISNQTFMLWQENELKYSAAKEIVFFPFLGKLNKQISQEKLLDLIKPVAINNPNAFSNSSYYDFLNTLNTSQQIIFNVNPLYEKNKQEVGGNTLNLVLDLIDNYANGLTKEVLYYQNANSKASSNYQVRFEKAIKNSFLRRIILEDQNANRNKFNSYDIVERLKALKANHNIKQRLISLFEGYKGTNLYIDFWGDWCGPCMNELPSYPKLIAALDGKPIKFLFFSVFTTEESMLAIKEKFKIKGDFVNLSKDEVAIVNNAFQFHSYPSHFMVNGKSKVTSKMSKISASNMSKKVEEITRLFAK